MNKKKRVSIGIPAYNEEANIGHLLELLLAQNTTSFVLSAIYVNSDGSGDRTDEIIRYYEKKDSRVMAVGSTARLGQGERQNQIFDKADSDMVVLLNADIIIKDRDFIEKLIAPIIAGKAELTSCRQLPIDASGWFEKVIYESYIWKNYVFEFERDGVNYFNCHGCVRAFAKSLYKSLRFPQSVGEDTFSYFFTLSKGYRFVHIYDTAVYFKCAENWSDYKKQSVRFSQSKNLFVGIFDLELVKREYKLGLGKWIRAIKYLWYGNLQYALSYVVIYSIAVVMSLGATQIENTWDRSMSTTRLFSK